MDKEQLITLAVLAVVVALMWQLGKLPMSWMKIGVRIVTFVSVVAAFWNLYQEPAGVSVFFIWCTFPVVSMAVCLKSSARGWVRGSFLYSCAVMSLYLLYALNGPSSSHGEGAAHMHILFFPFILGVISLLLVLVALRFRYPL